ncbi:unnamed protein product [Soboliphyme baturini]|uniref:Transposase n=1 Tax=Soboliphyme baturini TaxID=241478 RepID=A0A183J2J6_9BILA|nr:unnamed protein product [Soboliphyme baturini]
MVAVLRLQLGTYRRTARKGTNARFDFNRLEDPETCAAFKVEISCRFVPIRDVTCRNSELLYQLPKQGIVGAAANALGLSKRRIIRREGGLVRNPHSSPKKKRGEA